MPASYAISIPLFVADRFGEVAYLELSQSESTSKTGLHVVLLSGAVNHRAEESASRARSNGGGLLLAEQSAASLLTGLVEPSLHTAVPILLEVSIRQNVVVLHLFELYDRLDSITPNVNKTPNSYQGQ